jgi:hypothetical protein
MTYLNRAFGRSKTNTDVSCPCECIYEYERYVLVLDEYDMYIICYVVNYGK